jgi:hypothetical protein
MMENTMIYVTKQLSSALPQGLEQHFAACTGLGQSLSEEFDRSTELQAQTLQQTWESWAQFSSTMWQVKDPQEFFMLWSAHLHAGAEKSRMYWNAVHSLNQQIHEKIFAIEQTIVPMVTETLIEIVPTSSPEVIPVEPEKLMSLAVVGEEKINAKPGIKQEAVIVAPTMIVKAKPVKAKPVKAKPVKAKPSTAAVPSTTHSAIATPKVAALKAATPVAAAPITSAAASKRTKKSSDATVTKVVATSKVGRKKPANSSSK